VLQSELLFLLLAVEETNWEHNTMDEARKIELAKRFGVRAEDVELLVEAATQSRRPRIDVRLALAIALSFSCVVLASVRGELAKWLVRVSPPDANELVPRQVPYRGYLERDGIPVTAPQVFSFKLEYGDGGTAWTEPALTVPVSNGHFEVALGDATNNKIPTAVFSDPSVSLSVTVGGAPLVGKQRLLSVPYSVRALDAWNAARATEVDRILVGSVTINVGPSQQFTTLQDAWSWLQQRVVRGSVTVQLADGTYALPANFALNHPDGASIRIVGNVATPSNVLLAPVGGGSLRVSSTLALLDGVRISGGTVGVLGVNVFYGGNLTLGSNVVIDGFTYPVQVEGHAFAYLQGGTVTCRGAGVGVAATTGSYVQADGVSAIGCANGFVAISGGSLSCQACSVASTPAGWVAQYGSFLVASNAVGSPALFYASDLSVVSVNTPPINSVYDPPGNVPGNYGAWVRHP